MCIVWILLGCQPPPEIPNAYRIVTPDSLGTIRSELRQSWDRWNSFAPLSFAFSDSGKNRLFINDSVRYSNALFRADRDSLCVLGECVETDGSMLAVRTGSDLRFITGMNGRHWFLVGSMNELLNHDPQATEAVMLITKRRTALQSYKTKEGWKDVVNIFGLLRDYAAEPESEERYFKLHGEPIDYDPGVLIKTLTPFGSAVLENFRPTLFTYPDYETKVLVTGNVMEYHFDESAHQIHMVDVPLTRLRFAEIMSMYFARQAYGQSLLAESYGLWLAGTYYGKTFDWWKTKRPLLALVSKEELLQPANKRQNPFLRHLLGFWFWETRAQEAAIIFGNAPQFVSAFNPPVPPVEETEKKPYDVPRFKGVCFAHTNGTEHGYMSKQSASSLEAAAQIGVNAISVTPFGYSEHKHDPVISFILDGQWDETAGSLFKVTDDGKKYGMHVMMKPHIWLGSGEWCGVIEMTTRADVVKWMKSYREFITYHALIAELSGMNSLCLATELEKMAGYSEEWERTLELTRIAFTGPITYAANWSGEFRTVKLWNKLDFIGINHYFPLANDENYTVKDLQATLDTIATALGNFSSEIGKPIVFTEVGFASSASAFIQPHDEDYSKPASPETQALGYRLIFRTYDKKPWFKGYFWWKWESAETQRRRWDKSFHFRGKQAEEVIKVYYLN